MPYTEELEFESSPYVDVVVSRRTASNQTVKLFYESAYENDAVVVKNEAGLLLGSIHTHGMWLRTNVDGLNYSPMTDGTKEVHHTIYHDKLTTNCTVEIDVFRAGVTLDDGTAHRILSPADFDAFGRYHFNLYMPPGMNGGSCNNVRVYEDNDFVGQK